MVGAARFVRSRSHGGDWEVAQQEGPREKVERSKPQGLRRRGPDLTSKVEKGNRGQERPIKEARKRLKMLRDVDRKMPDGENLMWVRICLGMGQICGSRPMGNSGAQVSSRRWRR